MHPRDHAFSDPPPLPPWLAAEFPFLRRVFREGRWGMHFVDQGEGPVVLLQHGNPTWSFLWRKVIRRQDLPAVSWFFDAPLRF